MSIYKVEKLKKISTILRFNKSTVSREIKRNADGRNGSYHPDSTQGKYQYRMNKRAHYEKFDESLKLHVYILLEADFSPKQITGYFKRN